MRHAEIILASTSPARRALMDGLGLPYRVEAPGVDEQVAPGTPTHQIVRELARRKARAVASRHPEGFVIGADQLVDLAGEPLAKPENRAAARQQLSRLLGRTHDILTGVCVIGPGFDAELVDIARPTFFPLSGGELEAYLDTEEWQGCAGGYRIEGKGQWMVERLEGDRTSVQGLPMIALVRLLRSAGWTLP
jgi:septum formation protein